MAPSDNRAVQQFLERVNYFGQQGRIENSQVEIPQILREMADLKKNILIVGRQSYLEMYSLERLNELAANERFGLAQAELPSEEINEILLAAFAIPDENFLTALEVCNREVAKFVALHPDSVYDLRPYVFEELIAEVMTSYGYEVEATARTRDGGVDLIAVFRDRLGIPTRYLVECKRYAKSKAITVAPVRALYGVKTIMQADHAIFVTTSRFTAPVWQLINEGQLRNSHLVDRQRLDEWFDFYLREHYLKERT